MFLEEVFEQFLDQSPVSVMVRATLENVFAPERLDAVFHQHAILHVHEYAAAAMTGATHTLEHGRGWIRAADLPLLDGHHPSA